MKKNYDWIVILSLISGVAFADTTTVPSPLVLMPPTSTTLPSPAGGNVTSASQPLSAVGTQAIPAQVGASQPPAATSTAQPAKPAAPAFNFHSTSAPPLDVSSPAAMPAQQPAPNYYAQNIQQNNASLALPADAASTNAEQGIAAQEATQQAMTSSDAAFGTTPVSRQAFTQMLRNLMPLSPSQIYTLRNLFNKTQQAVSTYPGTPPKPTSSSILVNMSPGATPPVIRLRAGYVTSMVFLDSTGAAWPVVGYDLGNPKAFDIEPNAPDGKSNTLLIQALERYQQGNLAVMLKGEDTPVMLTLIPGQRAVDYRVDLRIPGLGPNALVMSSGLPGSENPMLLSFLDGTPPQDAKLLSVDGAPAQAWYYNGYLYLRARLTILSPGWLATMSSPDGTHVYQLAKTPLILASHRGTIVRLTIKGLS